MTLEALLKTEGSVAALLTAEQKQAVEAFYQKLLAENEVQNLTRLISPSQFIEGHLEDVLALRESGLVDFPAMDLGSGCGVPGLLCAVLGYGRWVLVDSEKKKAEFLERTSRELGLPTGVATGVGGRAEDLLAEYPVESVVARAVGPVERIVNWISKGSTWNTLVLLKGPSWDEEWAEFQKTHRGKHYEILGRHEYSVGHEKKKRCIVKIGRKKIVVPRGTQALA